MPNDTSMIFNVITRDGSSPAFKTIAAEVKALAAAMADADERMTASSRASTTSIDASLKSMAAAHRSMAKTVIADDDMMVNVTKATTAEMAAANDGLAASIAASTKAMAAAQREAEASTIQMGATVDKVAAESAAATEASAAKRKASMMNFGLASAAAVAFIGYESVKAATTFEASMARVQTMAGGSAAELKRMSAGILDLAPKVGVGPDKLAESLYHVESAGFSGAKALDMVAASAKLSAIGQDDINSSTQAVVATLASNIKGVKDANDAAAQILHTVGTGDMTMHQFTQALGTGLLATAAAVGLSFRDVGAAIATMTDNAIPADQAATKLRTSLLMMVNPSKPAAAALASIGMSSTALAGDLQKPDGLKTALDDIRTHLNAAFPKDGGVPLTIGAQRAAVASYRQELATTGVKGKELDKAVKTYSDSLVHGTTNTVLQEQAFAKMFGGSKNAGTMLVLFNEQLDRMDPKLASFGDSTSRAAELQAAWAKQQDTFKQKLNQLSAAFDVMKIKIGNALLPVLKDVIGFMGSHIGLVEALAVAIGTVLVAATVAWTVALQTNPVVLFVEALVVLGVEIYLLVTHFKQVTDFLRGPWGIALTAAVGMFLPVIGILASAAMLIMAHWKGFSGFFERVWHDVTAWFFDAWHAINTAARDIGGAAEAVGRFFQRMWHDVSTFTSRMWHDVAGFFARIYHDITGAVGAAVDFISRHWRLLITIFMGPIGFVISAVYRFRDAIGGAFIGLWRTVSGFAARMWRDVSGFVARMARDVGGWFARMWRDVSGFASRIWHDVAGFFARMWHDVASFASRIWHDVFGWFARLWHDVAGFASNIWHDVAGFFTRLWHDLVGISTRLWHEVSAPFKFLWDGLKVGFNDVVGAIKTSWDKLHEIFAVPIRFLGHYVYDDGIKWVWDHVMNVLGEKSTLPNFDYNHFATGGVIPGNHDRDTVPFYGTPGEVVVPKPIVKAYGGASSLMSMLGFDGKGGGPGSHLFGGGPIERFSKRVGHDITHPGDAVKDVKNVVGDVAHAVGQFVRGALADTAGPVLNSAISLFGKAVPGADHGWGKASVDMSHKMVDKVMDWIRNQDAQDQAAMGAGDGMSWPLILQYAYAHGIPHGAVTTTGGTHVNGSLHYAGEAVDFGNAAFPNQRQVFDVFSHIAPDLLELFWDPAGRYIKDGHWISGAIGGHGDHVHVGASVAGMDTALGIPISTAGGGVKRWDGVIAAALAMNGLSPALLGVVERQMQTESGGNASILQQVHDMNSGANAARGLMQVIPSTFSAYHMAGTSGDILDPLANVAAALNYAKHRYGSGLAGLGQGHGYANGGMPPVGEPFWVGERGPELLRLGPGGRGSRVYSNEESRQMVGAGGPLMHVENMNVARDVDLQRELIRAEFARQTANGFG